MQFRSRFSGIKNFLFDHFVNLEKYSEMCYLENQRLDKLYSFNYSFHIYLITKEEGHSALSS